MRTAKNGCISNCGYCNDGDPAELINCVAKAFVMQKGSKALAYYEWAECQTRKNGRGNWEICIPFDDVRTLAKKRGALMSDFWEWLERRSVRIPLSDKETDCFIYPLTPDRVYDIAKMRRVKK